MRCDPIASAAPVITIGLTCYNAEHTITRALESALAQDWPHTEVVIADDCSTDGSREKIAQGIVGHSHVRILNHAENLGPAAARNTILHAAKGDFIAFFDDDDASFPNRLRTQMRRILEHERDTGERLIFCYASGQRRYANGYEKDLPAIGSRPRIPKGDCVADYLLFNDRAPEVFFGAGTPTCALMARAEVLRDLGGFDSNLRRVEDIDLAVRLARAGGSFIGCPEDLFIQYVSVGFHKTPDRNLAAELALIDKHADYLAQKGMLSYARQWFNIRYFHFSGQRPRFLSRLALLMLQYPLRTTRHMLRSGPARLSHERKMNAGRGPV